MTHEFIKAKGLVQLVLTDEFGNIKEQQQHNLVVTTGLGYITSRMKDATAGAISHLGVGTGATAAAAADTALGTEIGTRSAATVTQVTTTLANDTLQAVATFAAGNGTGALTEAGIFNASTAGTMIARTVFSVINKGVNDTLAITWKITLA
jgi:hypothetical protein